MGHWVKAFYDFILFVCVQQFFFPSLKKSKELNLSAINCLIDGGISTDGISGG
jgi:hypothetical protein